MPIWIRSQDKERLVNCNSLVATDNSRFEYIIEEYEEYNENQPQGTTVIYMDTLKAIDQQCKELGWL